MSAPNQIEAKWIWPFAGPTPINFGLDSEMFDRTDYRYSETFVREAIQNSLDARLDESKPVIVNFRFHRKKLGTKKNLLGEIIDFRQESGLRIPPEWKQNQLIWLVIQDFNSTGLRGPINRRTSDFWNYWLNFGISNKHGSNRGGRGIGRVTFLISSRIQAVIGYTRSSCDGKSAICGMAALKPREDGQDFRSTHAYLAKKSNGSIFHLHDTDSFRNEVCNTFQFTEYIAPSSSGLALAIPYPHEELKVEQILAASIENFAPSILDHTLKVTADDIVLDADSIERIITSLAGDLKRQAIREDPQRYIDLVRRGIEARKPEKIVLPRGNKREIVDLRNSKDIAKLQDKLDKRHQLALEITFPLEYKNKCQNVSIRAVIAITPSAKQPLDNLFRDGMSLPDVRSSNPGNLDLILLVGHRLLANYLNLCEGKAHLDLLESKDITERLRDRGFVTPLFDVKRMIKTLPTELRKVFTPDITEPDSNVLETFFAVPSDETESNKKRRNQSNPLDTFPVGNPRSFKIDKYASGFRVHRSNEAKIWPINIDVRVVYADGSRKPSWSPFDFQLDRMGINSRDCTLDIDDNKLIVRNCGPSFSVEVTGFDTNRELQITARSWQDEN